MRPQPEFKFFMRCLKIFLLKTTWHSVSIICDAHIQTAADLFRDINEPLCC